MANTPFFHLTGDPLDFETIRNRHIIPSFAQDNSALISHNAFADFARELVAEKFADPTEIHVCGSHPILGRTFAARHKKINELLPEDQTTYYQRVAWTMVIPGFQYNIGGKEVSLSVAGVKAYNLDNIGSREGSLQNFKFAIGLNVRVCLNQAISTEGTSLNIKVTNEDDLRTQMAKIINNYSLENHLDELKQFAELSLREDQFAHLLGRLKLLHAYQNQMNKSIPQLEELDFTDAMINNIAAGYLSDTDFGVGLNTDSHMSLWAIHNLLTQANKGSVIDRKMDRALHATVLCNGLAKALTETDSPYSWFLN